MTKSKFQMKTILGIDPGLTGGIALKRDGQPAHAFPMPPTEGDLVDLLHDLVTDPQNTIAIVEEVSGYIGIEQPGSAAFKFGRNFGFLLGVIQTLGVRTELIKPQRWQRALGLGNSRNCDSKTVWKNKLKAAAQRLNPQLKLTLATADAVLILEYGLRSQPPALPSDRRQPTPAT
jgi:hypothetical protein